MPTIKNIATGTTKMEELFCENYATIGSPSYSDPVASAKEAGYAEKSIRAAASKLIHNDRILERCREIRREQLRRVGLDKDRVLTDIMHDKLLALRAGKLAESIKCSELLGKHFAMWIDRSEYSLQVMEAKKLTLQQAKEAKEFAHWRLLKDMTPAALPAVETPADIPAVEYFDDTPEAEKPVYDVPAEPVSLGVDPNTLRNPVNKNYISPPLKRQERANNTG